MVDDAGTLIDKTTRNTYDYVSEVCPVMNKLWEQTQRFEKHNQRLTEENEQLKRMNADLIQQVSDRDILLDELENKGDVE